VFLDRENLLTCFREKSAGEEITDAHAAIKNGDRQSGGSSRGGDEADFGHISNHQQAPKSLFF
jgi:hypothetical protein